MIILSSIRNNIPHLSDFFGLTTLERKHCDAGWAYSIVLNGHIGVHGHHGHHCHGYHDRHSYFGHHGYLMVITLIMVIRPVHKNLLLEFPKYPSRFMLHFDIQTNVIKGVLLKYRSFIKFCEPPILQGRIVGAKLP